VLAGASAGVVATVAAGATQAYARERGHPLADAVLAALRTHRIVAVGEIHGQQEHHDALQTLLLDPRLPAAVDDIVVEFGNALHQPIMDRFTGGAQIEDRELRQVWRNTTQSPGNTWDAPMHEQFFRIVRGVNWPLPAAKQIRVLLGDPPVDWAQVLTRDDLAPFEDRDGHLLAVLDREVVRRGRRALLCYGSGHVQHDGEVSARIEQLTGRRPYVIVAGSHPQLASRPRGIVLPAKGTWLESADSGDFRYFPGERGVPFGALADALLYLGQPGEQTKSLANPAIFLDPDYWTELQRRNLIKDGRTDLAKYRQEQPVAWEARPPGDC
jgi:hypothetical protein